MILGHSIALDPTMGQVVYFRRACGVARFACNWGLADRKSEFLWSYEVTKCASAQAIRDLGTAFTNFFRDLKKPKKERRFRYPRFKSKRADNGFALRNDQFETAGDRIRIPNLGWVRMHEALRFEGKIMGARVPRLREWRCQNCGSVHDRDANAARNLEFVVGRASPEPPGRDVPATRGEMGALAAPQGAVKLPSENRELNPCAHSRTD